jgi:hypothetical protein
MALIDTTNTPRDPRALSILAKSIYRELRAGGYEDHDVMALVGELLTMVANDVQERRSPDDG